MNLSVNKAFPQWKSLSDIERSRYEEMAKKDKERYEEECTVSDCRYILEDVPLIHARAVERSRRVTSSRRKEKGV